jgi:hypothetical protein
MELSEDENTEFEFENAGYQFTTLKNEPYGSVRLIITIRVKYPPNLFEFLKPMTNKSFGMLGKMLKNKYLQEVSCVCF